MPTVSMNRAVYNFNCLVNPVIESLSKVFFWSHRGFANPSINLYLPDGVHVNTQGQYVLYRSYRGAILKALSMLSISSK